MNHIHVHRNESAIYDRYCELAASRYAEWQTWRRSCNHSQAGVARAEARYRAVQHHLHRVSRQQQTA